MNSFNIYALRGSAASLARQVWRGSAAIVAVTFIMTAFPAGFGVVFADTSADLAPATVGGLNQWLLDPSSSDKVVATATNDGDTSYIKSGTNNHRQSFFFQNAGVPSGATINSVTLNVIAKKESSNPTMQLGVRNGSTLDAGASSQSISSASYTTYTRTMTTNPLTAAAWTDAEVNAWTTEFGVARSNGSGTVRITQMYLVVDYTPAEPETPDPGSIQITKYMCPEGTMVTRAANGVEGTPPEGCVLQTEEDSSFGYVHGTGNDANGPYDDVLPVASHDVEQGTTSGGMLTFSDLEATGRYLVFETDGNEGQLPNEDVLGLYCEGDGDQSETNDNQELTFVPEGGTAQCVAYNEAPASVTVTIAKYINDQHADAENTDNGSFSMHAIYPGGEGDYALSSTGFNNTNPYEATTSDMPWGTSDYSTYENTNENGPIYPVGASCPEGSYRLVGYKTGDSMENAQSAPTVQTVPAFDNMTESKWVIVVNEPCPPAELPSEFNVYIYKYMQDGNTASQVQNDDGAPLFPMLVRYDIAPYTPNMDPGEQFNLGEDTADADTSD